MKPAIFCALAIVALTSSAKLYEYRSPQIMPLKHQRCTPDLASFWCIPVAESGFDQYAIGKKDGLDHGMWQFRLIFNAGRGLKNPFDPIESTEVAAKEWREHYLELGSAELAMTAHKRGLAWTKRHGVDREYIKRARGF